MADISIRPNLLILQTVTVPAKIQCTSGTLLEMRLSAKLILTNFVSGVDSYCVLDSSCEHVRHTVQWLVSGDSCTSDV